MFFGDQRVALLEFLRNLTPQALILASALFFGSKLDLTIISFTFDGLVLTSGFVMSIVLWCGSICANTSRFFESVVSTSEDYKVEAKRIAQREISSSGKLLAYLKAALKHNKPAFVQASLAIAFTYASTFPVALLILQSLLTSLPLSH
jgi:hypothetical protein